MPPVIYTTFSVSEVNLTVAIRTLSSSAAIAPSSVFFLSH